MLPQGKDAPETAGVLDNMGVHAPVVHRHMRVCAWEEKGVDNVILPNI